MYLQHPLRNRCAREAAVHEPTQSRTQVFLSAFAGRRGKETYATHYLYDLRQRGAAQIRLRDLQRKKLVSFPSYEYPHRQGAREDEVVEHEHPYKQLGNPNLDRFLVLGLSKGTVVFVDANSLENIYGRFSLHRHAIECVKEIPRKSLMVSLCKELIFNVSHD